VNETPLAHIDIYSDAFKEDEDDLYVSDEFDFIDDNNDIDDKLKYSIR
jgi:hypothetical protein